MNSNKQINICTLKSTPASLRLIIHNFKPIKLDLKNIWLELSIIEVMA